MSKSMKVYVSGFGYGTAHWSGEPGSRRTLCGKYSKGLHGNPDTARMCGSCAKAMAKLVAAAHGEANIEQSHRDREELIAAEQEKSREASREMTRTLHTMLSDADPIEQAHAEAVKLDERRTIARAFLSTPDGVVLTDAEIAEGVAGARAATEALLESHATPKIDKHDRCWREELRDQMIEQVDAQLPTTIPNTVEAWQAYAEKVKASREAAEAEVCRLIDLKNKLRAELHGMRTRMDGLVTHYAKYGVPTSDEVIGDVRRAMHLD